MLFCNCLSIWFICTSFLLIIEFCFKDLLSVYFITNLLTRFLATEYISQSKGQSQGLLGDMIIDHFFI